MTDEVRNRIQGLRYVRAAELAPDPRNWRRHPDAQRSALETMLARVGYVDAVIARETPAGLVLVDGHLRADLAADAEIPVLVVDIDEGEAAEVLATLDPLAAAAGADETALAELLAGLPDDDGLDALLEGIHDLPATVGEDLSPAEEPLGSPPEPRSERGQVWQLGPHRVMCGDSTLPEHVARLMDGAEPECILTDPPYNSGADRQAGSKGTTVTTNRRVANDELSSRGYVALLKQAFGACPSPVVVYAFTDWRMWVWTYDVAESSGYGVRAMIVWDKCAPGVGMGWRMQHELILCGTRGRGLWSRHQGAQGNVISLPRQPNELHATQKPVELLAVILRTTPFAETVYDPFLGSGSTLIAAEQTGRACFGMELEPRYVDTTIARWEQYTGERAELAG
ncbi:DNA methyltransferase [Candidatus Palauibacter sp.]|uniref:DNA-methyltransferase n=1 Tax=Candidatus Palauibacter sp. TaxID=3101350 RepID=UPI003CC58911